MSDEPTPVVPEPDGDAELELAHPVARAVAFALDGAAAVTATFAVVLGGFVVTQGGSILGILLVPLGTAILCTVLTGIRGVTPGKALLGLRVVDAVTAGPIGWRAIPRSLVIVAPIALSFVAGWLFAYLPYEFTSRGDSFFGVTLLPPILGWLALIVVAGLRPRFRGLQDLAGRSIVVRR
jgi:uncharacterized RDD family membrane protein YckC